MNHYSQCGVAIEWRISAGYSPPRYVFRSCDIIQYTHPKVVVECIPEWGQKII